MKSATRKKEGGERIDDDGGFDARIVWGASLGSSLFSSCAQARKLDVWQGGRTCMQNPVLIAKNRKIKHTHLAGGAGGVKCVTSRRS